MYKNKNHFNLPESNGLLFKLESDLQIDINSNKFNNEWQQQNKEMDKIEQL